MWKVYQVLLKANVPKQTGDVKICKIKEKQGAEMRKVLLPFCCKIEWE